MALSGSILGSFSGKSTSTNRPKIYWSATQDSDGNYSDVTAVLYFWQLSSTYWGYNTGGTHNNTSNINGSDHLAYTNFDTRSQSGDISIRSRTVRVNHNSDGTKTCYIGWSGNTQISWGTYSFGTTVTLDTITRASAVTTSAASSVTSSSAVVGGNVTDAGIPANTDRGIYWGTTSGSQPNKISAGTGGSGSYSWTWSSRSPNTTYYYKAYSYNTSGYVYGSVVNFTTLANPPAITTSAVSSVYSNKATGNGNITNVYGANATRRGFCYKTGTTGDPTTADSVVYDDGDYSTGTFNKVITGLTASTNYRVRPYAVNSAGTGYGTTVQLTTLTDEHTLNLSDTLYIHEEYSPRKALKMAGVLLSGALGGWYVGSNYWAGGFTRTFIESFADNLKVRDNISDVRTFIRNLVESIVATDAFSAVFNWYKNLVDTISANDTTTDILAAIRSFIEGISIVDTYTRVVDWTRSLVESISLTEVFLASMLYLKGFVDNIVMSDLYSKTIGKVLSSIVVVTDAIGYGLQYTRDFVESVVIQEVFDAVRVLIRVFQDTISVIDHYVTVTGRYFTDIIQIGENWFKAFVVSLVDTINLEDLLTGITKAYTRVWQETITLSQNISKHVIILVTSILSIFDGEFVRKLNGQFIEWAKEIRKVVDWIKRGKDTDDYIKIERKLNDWELREKDLGSYQSNVKSLEEWTKLRKK